MALQRRVRVFARDCPSPVSRPPPRQFDVDTATPGAAAGVLIAPQTPMPHALDPRPRSVLPSTVFKCVGQILVGLVFCATALLSGCGPDEPLPLPPDPMVIEGERLLGAGKWSAAAALLERAVTRRPGDGRAMLLLGTALHKQKQYALARPWLERAAALDNYPRHEGAHYFLGWCLLNLGEMTAARAAFERHAELVPIEGDTQFGLGLVALELGEADAAVAHFERAIELSERAAVERPDRRADAAKAHARIADVLVERGDLQGARDRLQLAFAMWPQQSTVAFKLIEVLEELGDTRGAEEVRRMAEQQRGAPLGPR